MPDSRGREYGVTPGGGPGEQRRIPNNDIAVVENMGRVYANPTPAPEPTPAPVIEVEANDVENEEEEEAPEIKPVRRRVKR